MAHVRGSTRRWRWVRRGLAALVVGVVVTYGVAWGCALWSPLTMGPWLEGKKWPRTVPSHWPNRSMESAEHRGWGLCVTQSIFLDGGQGRWSSWSRSGWPCFALMNHWLQEGTSSDWKPGGSQYAEVGEAGVAGWTWMSGMAIGRLSPRADGVWDRLSLWPSWPGFAVNVALYVGVWLVVLLVPGAARRWRRIRRGQCGACGYDVKGIAGGVCPECGGGVG